MMEKGKRIGIVGLGLIGASLAKAYSDAGYEVFGSDKEKSIEDFALIDGRIVGLLNINNLAMMDYILIAIPPDGALEWINENAPEMGEKSLVIDCCGVKKSICEAGFRLARRYGFTFIGGHPMAGSQKSGFKNSSSDLFRGATFALVPEDRNDLRLLAKARTFILDGGFGRIRVMSPEEHDKIVSYTSQMAHLIANAYVKSPVMADDTGPDLSGGAFRDMTRVSFLDQDLWTELFIENRHNLIYELRGFIYELNRYLDVLEHGDAEGLCRLLEEGRKRKIEIENRRVKIRKDG
jgi:prephenate dehydrogenase